MACPTILSLFSGVGGLEMGIQLALPGAVVLGHVERDAYAASVLMARMEDESLERTPVFVGDIQNLDGSELRDRVDIICGGFPCQDISLAGRGAGIKGKRSGLWSEIVRLADEIRPRYLFLENVSAITSRGLDAVLADLASLGFDAEWLCLRASDVGAPHQRNRWFCLAHGRSERLSRTAGSTMANPEESNRREREPQRGSEGRVAVGGSGTAVDDTSSQRRQQDTRSAYGDEGENEGRAAQHDHEPCGANAVFPPGPNDHDDWRRVLESHPHLAPAVESSVHFMADGQSVVVDSCRADQLRCSGNAVVPLQAAVAFAELLRRKKPPEA